MGADAEQRRTQAPVLARRPGWGARRGVG